MDAASESTAAGTGWRHPCPRCRYDTVGLEAERCPECGITRSEAAALRRRKEQAARSAPVAALCTVPAFFAALYAYTILSYVHTFGFWNDAQRVRTAVSLGAAGGLIAVAVLNWARLYRRVPLLSLWWVGVLVLVVLFMLPA